MAAVLSSFEPVDGLDNVYTAQKATLRCTAIALRDGGVCLFSPVQGLGDAAKDSLSAIGRVTQLLAPNHYHNKGLAEYADAFPDAILCASAAAAPRLRKVTGLDPADLGNLKMTLPRNMKLIETDGLKTGEVWLRSSAGGRTTWFVVDAFSGPKAGKSGGVADAPEMLKTFPNFGVADRTVYAAWVAEQIDRDRPDTVVPCHGAIVRAPDLPKKLAALVAAKL